MLTSVVPVAVVVTEPPVPLILCAFADTSSSAVNMNARNIVRSFRMIVDNLPFAGQTAAGHACACRPHIDRPRIAEDPNRAFTGRSVAGREIHTHEYSCGLNSQEFRGGLRLSIQRTCHGARKTLARRVLRNPRALGHRADRDAGDRRSGRERRAVITARRLVSARLKRAITDRHARCQRPPWLR